MVITKELKEVIASWLKIDANGNLDLDKTSQALFVKTLAGRDNSFAIIAIRCNSKDSTGKRKLAPGKIYYFLQGYTITDECIIVENWRDEQNKLYDDSYYLSRCHI